MEELRIKNLEEIVTFTIKKTIEILEKKFVLVPKEEWEIYDRKILGTLKKFDKPVSIDYLAHETGIEKPRLCKKLKILEKYGKVKCVTKKVTSYWKIID